MSVDAMAKYQMSVAGSCISFYAPDSYEFAINKSILLSQILFN